MLTQSASEQSVKLSIECPKRLFSGAENFVTIVVRNGGEKTIEFESAAPQFPGAGVEVSRRGKLVSTTTLGKEYFMPTPFPRVRLPTRLEKGQEFRVKLNLTRYFDLSIPGDAYQIVATWRGNVAASDESIRIRTEPLDFEVKVKKGEGLYPKVVDGE